jgi:hypothetical protein
MDNVPVELLNRNDEWNLFRTSLPEQTDDTSSEARQKTWKEVSLCQATEGSIPDNVSAFSEEMPWCTVRDHGSVHISEVKGRMSLERKAGTRRIPPGEDWKEMPVGIISE